MRFPRMTTRRWMVGVAATNVVLWSAVIERRADAYRRRAIAASVLEEIYINGHARDSRGRTQADATMAVYWGELRRKYEQAGRHPWLPVPPDPPEPK